MPPALRIAAGLSLGAGVAGSNDVMLAFPDRPPCGRARLAPALADARGR